MYSYHCKHSACTYRIYSYSYIAIFLPLYIGFDLGVHIHAEDPLYICATILAKHTNRMMYMLYQNGSPAKTLTPTQAHDL